MRNRIRWQGGLLFTWFWLFAALAAAALAAPERYRLIETSPSVALAFSREYPGKVTLLGTGSRRQPATMLVPASLIDRLARLAHRVTGRCGGFTDITGERSGSRIPTLSRRESRLRHIALPPIDHKRPEIERALTEIDGARIEAFVSAYSSHFRTRYAGSPDGEQAAHWLKDQWESMARRVNGARPTGRQPRVELLPAPQGYKQPSVKITIPGEDESAPRVILGAHLDSINLSGDDTAPGADDDASGIASLTEIYRVLLQNGFQPRANLELIGYAAEEVGLLGSRVVAEHYHDKDFKVLAVLQLDMDAYPSETKALTFITDHVNRDLTLWTEQLYGLYVGERVEHDRCGYACSDHASWDRYGFPAVMPFESPMRESNPRIHSSEDLWDSRLDAGFAARFARLAYAFAAELSR